MNALLREGREVLRDLAAHHFGVHDDVFRVRRIERACLQRHHVAMKGTESGERSLPPRRELFAALQPHAVQSVAGTIDVLLQRSFQAEDAVERLLLQGAFHPLSEALRALRPRSGDGDAVKLHTIGMSLPLFRKEMRFMPRRRQRGQQPLHIQLRASGGGELAADEGEFHVREIRTAFPAILQSWPSACGRSHRSAGR